MNELLSIFLTDLNAAHWPSSEAELSELLERAGYKRYDVRGTHQHWKRGQQAATLCHEPSLDVTFMDADLVCVPFPKDDDAYESAHRELRAQYDELVEQASQVLSPPAFEGSFGADGFPESQDAARLAAWQKGRTLCCLAFKDDGPIAPLRLTLVLELLDSEAPTQVI